jgi:peptide/nickel transport system substrate-binding protein
MLTTEEIPGISALGEVTADNLRKIGVNVEIATSDWGAMVVRRAKKDPPGQGGWNLFHTTVGGTTMFSPLTNFTINSNCDRKNWFGWPCDAKTEELRMAYVNAADKSAQQAALDALHRHLWEELPDIPVGQYTQPFAWRSNVTGVLHAALLVFWNIDKD